MKNNIACLFVFNSQLVLVCCVAFLHGLTRMEPVAAFVMRVLCLCPTSS